MNFNKLSISDLIDQQLPSFVVDQFPTFVKFFEEYYKSLEIAGGLLDITDNILEYKNIDNLRKFNLVSTYKLTQAITETSDSIVLDNIDGLPPRQGVISIGNEVILYDSLHVASKTLNGCQRGFTATTKFSETATTVSETVAASHAADSKVTNLSNLILFLVTKNYEEQYLAGFPFENISSDIGKDTLIRNIKDFYSYKGTDISIEFLFRTLFEEEVTVRYPKDYVIKSSYSDWTVDDIIKVEQISGNPYDLVGNELKQTDASGLVVDTALVDQILVNNISNYASGNKNIYEIRLNVLDQSFFKIPQESILRGPLNSTSTVITVDSTIGFPDLNGIVQIDNEIITYRYKTFNQFIDCGRGVYGTVASSHANQSPLRTTEYLFGYSGSGEQIEANKVTMRLLGIVGGATVIDGASYYNEGELIKLSPDGDTDDRPVFTSWRRNETGALSSSSDVQLNASIKNTTTGVTAVYKDETYAYVASTGLPEDPIGDFIGVGFDVRNQNHLKTIPLQPEKNTQTQYAGKRPVGLFVDGVQAYSCEDYDEIAYGSIESVNIVQSGFGFETNIQPVFRISNSTGSNATFEGEILNGKISKINITNGGSGYTQDHDLEVTYGFDATATIVSDTDISKGSIKTITVTNSGQDYVATPSVEIVDITGKGKGAYAIAEVTNNQVTGIIVLNGGVDYTDKNNIRVNIISKGTGVVARAIVKKWAFDRVFKTTHSPDTNGNWGAAQTIKSDTGNGYLYPSRNVRYNLEYGYPSNPKLLRHRLIDNVQGVNANYDEKTSGFTHSPILGWAYDGNPIYGPYGYVDPYDTNSSITRQTSSYVLKTAPAANRPPVSRYPLGAFVDDYEFIQGSGSLDRNNGRFCKTPDFPEGRYCYFITVTSLGAGVFPYIIGTTFYSVPSQNNYNNEFDQSLDSNLPAGVRRIRSINTPSKGFDASLIVGEVQRGVIENFSVYSSGDSFKKLDYLFIDNTDTEGSRAFGRVESVKGVNVPRVSYAVASGFTHPLLTTTNGIPDAPWPVDISAPYLRAAGITYDIFVETATPHLLSNGDVIDLALDRNSIQATKTFKVRVSNYQTVTYSKPVVDTELVADVAFNQTTINVVSADEYREDDYLLINDEILKIVSIDTNLDQITVDRAQFGTPLRLHASTNKVSLYIPDSDQDYRIAVGDAISSPGVSGVIYSIDKQNSSFEVRIISGSLTNSSTISDSSTPTARDITISSVSEIRTYWEIDPTNTGNHYVRDLSFRMIRGTEYRFDVSDGSNFGNKLIFTEDSTNINTLTNVEYYGTAGTVGSYIVITKQALLNFDVSRVYYYEQNNQVLNNKSFFSVLTLPSGTQTVRVLNDNLFTFNIPIQPELTEYVNLVSYTTTSQTAIGAIDEILVIDGGEGYKKLPKIEGITHSQLDDAKFTYSITNGSFDDSISVISTGNRYSADTKIIINTLTGSGAVLEPVIVGGRIISVNVVDAGDGYDENDTIVAVDTNCQIFAVSDSIGKIKTVRFNNYGSQFNPDRTLSKSLIFNKKVIVTDVQNGSYKLSETVTTSSGFNARINKIQEIGSDTLLLDLEVRSGDINVGDTLTGVILQTTSYVYEISEPDVVGNISGFISKVGFFDSDLGKLSSSSQKITDSYYYQDFSYVIRSTKGLSDYKKYVDETTHPLGFKLFGEVSVENDVDFEDTVTGAPFSIGFADDPYKGEVIITLPNINVESDIVFKKYEISRVNTTNLRTYTGTGGALLNFLDNQIEATQIADLSANLDVSNNNYTLTTNDGNFPIDTLNTSVLIALNEVFQEPFATGEITGISYDNSIATITTSSDHNLAITAAGQTYPNQKYIHIEGVTYSGNLNFNDKFEVYDVPSSNTFRVLFNNPNGFLTNNDPAVCADVQSTVDNLTGILTTAVSVSGYQLPASNQGIWLDPATSTIVSANRHRDAADLILLNKQEIIDRANAEIAVQYPDFYYPNDPQTTAQSRYKDSYRLIQLNRQEIIDGAFAEIAIVHPTFVNPNSDKCKRDLGYFVDAISLDVHTGGNVYARKFLGQYFNSIGTSLTTNGLAGEVLESITAFNKARDLMKDAITNQLTVQDLTITADPVTGSNTDPLSCADVRSNIDNLVGIVTFYLNQGSLTYPVALPAETVGTPSAGEAKCKRDLGYIVDAVIGDLKTGGNSNIVAAAQAYVDGNGNLIANGIDGEVNESVTAFNKARDLMKLALANQLYGKDFNILPDFLGTSGVIDPADVSGSIFIKGQFEYDNANLKLYEAVKEGTTFYSIFFKFVSAADDVRYSYKLRDILFDGVTKEFPLLKLNGSNVVTEADENLLVFIDGVLQIYGESYTIDRSVNPNVIKFYDVYDADRQFFSYTFSKYKILNNIADQFDSSKKSFELKFGDDNILPPDTHQILVMLDGVPQVEGKSYSIVDNVLTFTEAPTKDKDCHILYFYGKTFDKTVSIWNGEVFERIQYIGENTPDGCKYYSKVDNTVDIIQPGDLIKIDGETTKQIIGIEQRTLENTDNLVYTAFVYTDNSYIRGKNAVASAVVSGVPVVGGNTVTVSGTVAVSGTTGVPPVYDYQVVGFNITNPGLEYDVAPIVLFKTNCDNPGKGAEAYAEITNGKVTNIVVTNPGGGYTEAPELIFAKKYEIIRPYTPIFTKQEVVLDVGLNDKQAVPVSTGFNVIADIDEEHLLPIVMSQLTSSNTTVLEVENKTNRDTSQPGLAYVLNTFDQNKFKYEPINLNDPLAPYLGTGVTIEMMNRYAPTLTIEDFETHAGSSRGATEPAIINIGLDSYISYGLTLTNSISNLATTITVTGDVSNFPPTGYLEFGNETIEYTSIAGQDFTVIRGSGSVGHSAGDYLRLAWRG